MIFLSTIGADTQSFQSYQNSVNYNLLTVRVGNRSFQNYLKTGRCYTSLQLLELKTVAFRATKILSLSELIFLWTTGVDGCSFQSYLKPGRCHAYRQLTTIAFRATKILPAVRVDIPNNRSRKACHSCQSELSELVYLTFLSTVRVDNSHSKSYLRKYYQLISRFLISVFLTFSVSYTKPLENTWTRALPNLCYQIKVSFILEFFLREANELSTCTSKIIGISKQYYNAFPNSPVTIKFFLFCLFLQFFLMLYDCVTSQKQ